MSIARRARLVAPLALASLFVGTFGAGCASASDPSSAPQPLGTSTARIIGGTTDTSDTFVVGIYNQGIGGICSGTLLAKNLVLTARHCVSDTTQTVDCSPSGYYTPKVTRDYGPSNFQVTTSQDMNTGSASWYGVSRVYVLDDQSCPNSGNVDCDLCGADLAMLELDGNGGYPSATPVAPAFAPPAVGELHAAIGYGCQQPEPTCGNVGQRMTIDTQVTGLAGYDLETNGKIAGGDSGGPYFDRASKAVYAVTSRGPQDASAGLYTRVDVHLDWIIAKAKLAAQDGGYTAPAWTNQAPPAKPAPPLALGETCTANAECVALDPAMAPGVCHRFSPSVPDRRCSEVCTTSFPCPSGFDCVTGYCWPHADNPPQLDAGPAQPDTATVDDTGAASGDDAGAGDAASPVVVTPSTKSGGGCSVEAPADRPPRPMPWIVGAAVAMAALVRRRRG